MKVNEGLVVAKTSNIHVKVELDRNPETNAILLKTVFNPKAPNISNDKKEFIWEPTPDEIDFLFQAFNLFPSSSQKQTNDVSKESGESKTYKTTDEASNEPDWAHEKEDQQKPFDEEASTKEITASSENEFDTSEESSGSSSIDDNKFEETFSF